jgi:hypothetical protein
MTEQLPPAGWYPDPGGSGRLRYFNGSTWTDQYSKASRRRIFGRTTPSPAQVRARLVMAIILVVLGLPFTIFSAVVFASPDYGQPGTVECDGHPMRRDEICRYDEGGRSSQHYVETYDQKLAHQTSEAKRGPPLVLGMGLLFLLLGSLGLLQFYRRRRGPPG